MESSAAWTAPRTKKSSFESSRHRGMDVILASFLGSGPHSGPIARRMVHARRARMRSDLRRAVEGRHHRCVVAGPHFGEDAAGGGVGGEGGAGGGRPARWGVAGPQWGGGAAGGGGGGEGLAGEDVVDPPADVALAHVAPRRPPGEQAVVVRLERTADVDQPLSQDLVEEVPLVRALADDAGPALLGGGGLGGGGAGEGGAGGGGVGP